MPYRKEQFVNGGYYHVLNRGIDGRNIFMEENDYLRFLECLAEFNTNEHVTIQRKRKEKNSIPTANVSSRDANAGKFQNLVKIICYCLLPNHFHLLLKQINENGVPKFIQKLCGGFTQYFNLKNERHGYLFQGAFKAVPILKDAQLLHISRYIHLNVLDLKMPEWREGKLFDWQKAKEFLENYPWSSYPIFIGEQKSDFCQQEIMGEIFRSPLEYEGFVKEWSKRGRVVLAELALE